MIVCHVIQWQDVLTRQCGVAASDQLLAAGLSRRKLARAVADGLVERCGPRLVVDPHWSAAGDKSAELKRELFLLVCSRLPAQRKSVAVFRRAAAALWGLDGFDPRNGCVPAELAIKGGRPSVGSVFQVPDLLPKYICWREGLPVTSVARTLLDLGQVVDATLLERALESALRRSYITLDDLSDSLDETAKRWGTAVLRDILASRPKELVPTESDAETLFVQLVRRAGFPAPERQFVVSTPEGFFRLDFAWPPVRLGVEIDGAATHASAGALVRDLRRQNSLVLALSAAGWVLLRFSWSDLVGDAQAAQTLTKLREAWSLCRGTAR